MKKLLYGVFGLALVAAAGCALTDYPVITDSRGDFSGVVRTGHKAYVEPTSQIATIWDDGSDELFSMIYQNNYGDQKIYTFNNFDPSASVVFLDQTYCDWRYSGCEITRAWNPHQDNVDNIFDYEFFPDCSGARSLSLLVSNSSRVGECGDGMFNSQKQNLMAEFANLGTTNWRGAEAYIVPISADTTSVRLYGDRGGYSQMPIYGSYSGFITGKLQFVLPMTANARHELRWLQQWVANNGNTLTAEVNYGSLTADVRTAIATSGISYNLDRF